MPTPIVEPPTVPLPASTNQSTEAPSSGSVLTTSPRTPGRTTSQVTFAFGASLVAIPAGPVNCVSTARNLNEPEVQDALKGRATSPPPLPSNETSPAAVTPSSSAMRFARDDCSFIGDSCVP